MTKALFFQALAKIISGFLIISALLFIPAGTFEYQNAWIFLALLFIPMFIAGIIMMLRSPELLKKRLNAKEDQSEQKSVIALSALMFICAFVAAGLNFRFSWIVMPSYLVYAGIAVFLASYLMYAFVLKQNEYLSRTVEVQKDQHVVDTGLYGVIRHPMYCATLFLFLSMGFILGSYISVVILLLYIPIIAKRIRNEEKVLEEGLAGYREYKKKVRYKVIPFIW